MPMLLATALWASGTLSFRPPVNAAHLTVNMEPK